MQIKKDLIQSTPVRKPAVIDPQRHVKMWFSKDGLPEKHQARFIRFLALNPDATLYLIYSDKYLRDTARANLEDFATKASITLIDYDAIAPRDANEVAIKKWIDKELAYFFKMSDYKQKGNLSVVSDQLRMLQSVLELGIPSDCDVEFQSSLPKRKLHAPLGFIAKTRFGIDGHTGGIRISNDLVGGDGTAPVFELTRRLTVAMNARYHAGLPAYFKRNNIAFDPKDYENHPHYFRARNEQLKMFSLGGGPQLFAIAVHLCGFGTGYEDATNPEVYVFDENYDFHPFVFKPIDQAKIAADLNSMLPYQLRESLVAHWDHSWEEGNISWKVLSTKEKMILRHFNQLQEYSGRINHARFFEDFSKFVTHISMQTLSKSSLSMLKGYLSGFLHVNLPGRRHREFLELRQDEQNYILKNETPDQRIRDSLVAQLGPEFAQHAKSFDANGFLILPGFFKGEQLAALNSAYEIEINKKNPHPFLKQICFNAAVDELDPQSFDTVFTASTEEHLQALIRYHFGQYQCVAAMRGYKQLPTSEVLYRAWDYHQDLKTKGPTGEIKMMILLTDVQPEGQAMRVIPGSHKYHWFTQTQQDTKYSLDEALGYSNNGCATICYGPPGTVILFDTNILHSGHRNGHSVRDIYTISYVPNTEDAPVMSKKLAERKEVTTKQQFNPNVSFWKNLEVNQQSLTPAQTMLLQEHYRNIPKIEHIKERFNLESSVTLQQFIIESMSTDVNGDLDLQLRMGKKDTIRDNQLIALRDVPLDHNQYHRLRTNINNVNVEISYDLNIDEIRKYAKFATRFQNVDNVREIQHCATFAFDLEEAFNRIDSIQRLRTTLAFLYFTLDRMAKAMDDNKIDPYLHTKMAHCAKTVLGKYISLVYVDDLAQSLESSPKR